MAADVQAPKEYPQGLVRSELDALHCAVPGCPHTSHDELFLHSRCHPKRPLTARFTGTGCLMANCAMCGQFVGLVAIAPVDVAKMLPIECADPACTLTPEDHCKVLVPHGGKHAHKHAGTFVKYGNGTITVVCAKPGCESLVAEFAVKDGASS